MNTSRNRSEFDTESALRDDAKTSAAAALVLADFYEERGQPTRAKMWRRTTGIANCIDGVLDLFVRHSPPYGKMDPRRDAMVWLLHNVLSSATIARLFRISKDRPRQIAHKQERFICWFGYQETGRPTMAATQRLIEAHALRPMPDPFSARDHVLGDIPPETWPATRAHEIERVNKRG